MNKVRAIRRGFMPLAVAAVLSGPIESHAGARQPLLGDPPSVFAAAYGQPTLARHYPSNAAYGYGRCAGRSYPPILATFAQGAAFAVAVYPCNGRVSDDWRARAKAYLPPDATFSRTQSYGGTPYWLYDSRTLAEAVPGAICGASDTADGQVAVARMHFTSHGQGADLYMAAVLACLQPKA